MTKNWMINGLLLASLVGWSAGSFAEEEGEGKKPFSRSVELTDAAQAKCLEKYPGGEIVSQKSFWLGNGGQAGNGTLGGTRRWEVVVKTKKEEPVPEGKPKPEKPKMIEELHTLVVKKDGFVVSQTDPINPTDIPEAVKQSALEKTGGTKIESGEMTVSALSTRYKVKTDKGTVTLKSDGTVVPDKYSAPQETDE